MLRCAKAEGGAQVVLMLMVTERMRIFELFNGVPDSQEDTSGGS